MVLYIDGMGLHGEPLRPLVLNVDDNTAGLYARTRMLQHAGFDVLEATDGAHALELAAARDPDVILLDVHLPDIDGFEVCRRLRSFPPTAGIPVIYVTSTARPSELQSAGIDAGAEDYLVEPVDPKVLVSKIRHFARARRNARQLDREMARRRESEERLQAILRELPAPTLVFSSDGEIVEASASWGDATGYSREDVPSVAAWAAACSDAPQTLLNDLLGADPRVRDAEHYIRTRAGDVRCFLVSVSPIGALAGGRQLRCACLTDITERKRAQQELAASHEEYRVMGETLPYGVWRCNPQGGSEYVSQSFLDLLEMTQEQGRQFGWISRLPPEDVQPTLDRWLHCIRTGEPWDSEHRILGPDGKYHHVLTRGRPVRDASGKITSWVGINLDIDARKAMEQALCVSEQEFRSLFEWAGAAVALVELEGGRYLRVNPRCRDMLGYSAEELLERTPLDITHPEDRPASEAAFRALASGAVREYREEKRCVRKDGAAIWVDFSLTTVDTDGSRLAVAIAQDITFLKQAEEALRASEQRYSALAETLPGILFLAGFDGCEYVNGWWRDYTGMTLEQSLGFGWTEALHPEDRAVCERRWRHALVAREPFVMEYRLRGKDGAYRWFRANAAPIRNRATGAVRLLGIAVDVEEQKRGEAALRESQRHESIASLAGGVAHNLNNMLVGVMGTASFIAGDAPPELREALNAIIRSSQRAADLTAQLLAYAGKGNFVVRESDLSKLAASAVPLIESNISRDVRLELDLPAGLPPVEVDRNQIRQVVMSLAMNAAEAIGGGKGVIAIRTAFDAAAGAVILEVSDTGCGMDEPTRARIFEPFFTTKFTGRGLGLAAARGIVRSHRGAIDVTSTPGQGSTFRLTFPAVKKAADAAPALPASAGSAILLVDDEPIVLQLAAAAVERAGYSPLPAADGRQAVDLFRRRGPEIALVVLDLVMPDLDGVEALRAIRGIRPDVPVLISSGYQESDVLHEFRSERVEGFLQKPYTVQRLLDAIAAILPRRP